MPAPHPRSRQRPLLYIEAILAQLIRQPENSFLVLGPSHRYGVFVQSLKCDLAMAEQLGEAVQPFA